MELMIHEFVANAISPQSQTTRCSVLKSCSLFQVWFKNRRAKCRQNNNAQKASGSGTRNTRTPPGKTKARKSSPALSTNVRVPANIPTPTTAVSPPVVPVKRESPQASSYKANGTLTPAGSNASSGMTPSPPGTPSSSNPAFCYQHEAYNSFNWHAANGHNASPHHYYGQNYNPAYYNQMEYFNQQSGQAQMPMANHVGGSYQMGSYPGMSMGSHHQNFAPRHPDCSVDYLNQMVQLWPELTDKNGNFLSNDSDKEDQSFRRTFF